MTDWDKRAVKDCPKCGQSFSLNDFVEDPQLVPRGVQFADETGEHNCFHFEHRTPQCGATFPVSVMLFSSMISEPLTSEVPTGTASCERHCFDLADLAECDHPCLYAPFRRLIIGLKQTKGA